MTRLLTGMGNAGELVALRRAYCSAPDPADRIVAVSGLDTVLSR